MRGAAESAALGDLGDREVAEPQVGEIVPAPAQPLLPDPAAERDALAGEQPVQLSRRDVAGPGNGFGRESGIAQARERVLLQLAERGAAARVRAVPEPAGLPQRADREVQPGVDERLLRRAVRLVRPRRVLTTRNPARYKYPGAERREAQW
jgi:hypothetical protein